MTAVDAMTLDADTMKRLRNRAGLTQQELATNSGLSIAQIVALEQGKRDNPRLDTLRKLAAGLGCTVAELIGEAGQTGTEPPKRGRKGK
jgi:transcriptional regulator with XRE-family HTH domain